VGDFFYVLDTGHCDIHVEGVGKVMDVGPGGSFGELALMYDAPRAATVVRGVGWSLLECLPVCADRCPCSQQTATEPCRTWALDQLTFKKTIMATTMKKRQCVGGRRCGGWCGWRLLCEQCLMSTLALARRHENFIKSVPILSTLNQYERLTIADALNSESFKENEVAVQEGDAGDKFYIVESGEFKVTKAGVDREVHDRLTAGGYFGERALLTNEARAATVTATTGSVCQVLDRATFKRLLGPLEDIMRKNMEVYNKYKDSVPDGDEEDGKKEEEDEDDDEE